MIDAYNQEFKNLETLEDSIKEELVDAICHGILVSNLAVLLAKELGETEEFCYSLSIAGLLHDIGKIKMNRYLYGKGKDALLIEEMKYFRMHSAYSYDVLRKKGYPLFILEAIYHHHENYDGSGYPHNLKGEDIPLSARILRVCDVFAALTSNRTYRAAFDLDTAIQVMIDEVKNFDMRVFLAFQRVLHSDDFEMLECSADMEKVMEHFEKCFFGNPEVMEQQRNRMSCYDMCIEY